MVAAAENPRIDVVNRPTRVLIVDRSRDSRDVLRMLLERQGAETVEVTNARRGLAAVRQARPDLIVVDADAATNDRGAALAEAAGADTPIVVLGSISRDEGPMNRGLRIAKPYHYGQLIRKIEGLLEKTA